LSANIQNKEFMNKSFSDPELYIQFDAEHVWLPHIELLIRAGIAKQHPEDAYKIRLINFHS